MARSKLTPQEIYRQRKQREELEKTAYLPPGLVNHGNTCFMNSVLQGLLATRLLADLVYFNPIPQEMRRTASGPIVSTRSPQLMNGHGFAGRHKLPYVSGMPIGDAFLDTLDKAWYAQANRRREVHSPRILLATIGRKYDQYLDFAQQDAHEFLRILLDAMRMEEFDVIKIRQPPPPPKKRRRTTITPENARDGLLSHLSQNGVPLNGASAAPTNQPPNSSSQSTSVPKTDDLPLMSFVDMIFGGQLTSILVCQKCKHVSQTYEDFNDISLSLKPEDYANRKRDRFKKIVGRLTNFPSSIQGKDKPTPSLSTNSPPAPLNTVEMLRSSSVPSTPSKEKQTGDGLEGPPIEESRRRSLDISVESLLQDGAVDVIADSTTAIIEPPQDTASGTGEAKAKEVDEDPGMISDGSNIIVNVSGPEKHHVEFVEPPRKKEASQSDQDVRERKQAEDAGWSKFGRRISLNLGLGRQKDKKERERKARSMERTNLNTGSVKEGDTEENVTIAKAVSVPGASPKAKVSLNEADNNAESSQRLQQQPIPSAIPSSTSPNRESVKDQTPNTSPKFPAIQRSRSPKPPKPSASETEYLRKILADISFPSNNPFALLRPPLHESSSAPVGEKEKVAGPAWLGLGSRTFSGIEECLRMFTAVEVLDGENMVGCRRCWKIQNGVFQSNSDEEEDEDRVEDSMSPPGTPNQPEVIRPPLLVKPTLNIAGPTSPSSLIHLQASQSTPTVSYYPEREAHSISSLPTSLSDANLTFLKDKSSSADCSDSQLSLSVVSERSEYTTESTSDVTGLQQGPGGLPIPIISTTAPMDASSSTPSDSGSESHYSSASEGPSSSLPGSMEELNRRAAYAQLTRGILKTHARSLPQVPSSTESLAIPPRRPHGNRRRLPSDTTTDEGSSEDESDASGSTSVSGIDSTSALGTILPPSGTVRSSSQQVQGQVGERSQKKVSKPKPVIMRPAYKRYLIATPPPVLVIHLKRFQQTLKAPLMLSFSNGFKKLDDYVSFPEYLDLSPFLAPRKEDYGLGKKRKEKEVKKKSNPREERCMYRLYGVVVHIGNMLGGHYVAYTALPTEAPRHHSPDKSSESIERGGKAVDGKKTTTNSDPLRALPRERQWAHISDTHVRLTTLEEVLNSKAYICMYERC